MTEDTALEREIGSLLLHNLNVEASSVDEDLIESGLLDSLKIVELLMELEHRFGFRIPFEDLDIESFRSVASIARLTASLCAATALIEGAGAVAPDHAMRFPAAD